MTPLRLCPSLVYVNLHANVTCPYLRSAVGKVYPIGIPALYFFVLWRKRHLLNPRIDSGDKYEGDNAIDEVSGADFVQRKDDPSVILLTASNGQAKAYWPPQQLKELDERVKARAEHPELTPFMFLWRDFGER